ncbi:class A beta-lactamase-related serine hydrolase [Rossellomorea aquimaris]|uniref:serine hydrolase n=1 Tax=Rossellomorea aquimaris TaxID=189382 RepID=UPI001CD7D3DD|nr:serine hydrolase [Rossellomorea aquimaris]MCA1053855.1 class A beta-lactamase-related serine hydrolase [Rossellomorea aquimaris]
MTNLEHELQRIVEDGEGRVTMAIDLPDHSIRINSEEKVSAASLIKLPILLQGFRQIEEGLLNPDEVISVPLPEKVGGAGILSHLSQHSKVTIHDLLTLMIIVSDNTATNLLIDRIGMDSIKEICEFLELKETQLNRKMMDFEALRSGKNNVTSARDVLTCLKTIDHGKMFHPTSRDAMSRMLHHQQFNQKLPAKVNRDFVDVGNKTGELPGVEHDCAIFRHKEHTFYTAVLIDGLSDNEIGSRMLVDIGKCLNDYLMKEYVKE